MTGTRPVIVQGADARLKRMQSPAEMRPAFPAAVLRACPDVMGIPENCPDEIRDRAAIRARMPPRDCPVAYPVVQLRFCLAEPGHQMTKIFCSRCRAESWPGITAGSCPVVCSGGLPGHP